MRGVLRVGVDSPADILGDSAEHSWSRGVTVSTLDSESSDRGSNPREAFTPTSATSSSLFLAVLGCQQALLMHAAAFQPLTHSPTATDMCTWPRGVTVSTLDSESSDRGSNPHEAFLVM